ncbi:unnamed protein product [Trichobilharzia szidati]|nr:unnamed protein product [Trichobilharzia szidati]
MDFIPDEILSHIFLPKSHRSKDMCSGHSVANSPKNTLEFQNFVINTDKTKRFLNTISNVDKTDKSPPELVPDMVDSFRVILNNNKNSHIKRRKNVTDLCTKLDKILQEDLIFRISPINDSKHFDEYKEKSSVLLCDVKNVFEKALLSISCEQNSLLVNLLEKYEEIFEYLLNICSNLHLAVVSGRNDLCLKNVEGLKNRNNLQAALRSLTEASSSNTKLLVEVGNLHLEFIHVISSANSNETAISNVHKLYKLLLQRIESDQRKYGEENHICFYLALDVVKMFCDRNILNIIGQLQTSKDKWVFMYDRSFLMTRKLITQLYELLTACTEGVIRFSEHLEYLFMSSNFHLEGLLRKIEKFEMYLHPTFKDDVQNRNLDYATHANVHLTDVQDTAHKVLNKISELWNVKKNDLINHIGLNSGHYDVNNSENEDEDADGDDDGDDFNSDCTEEKSMKVTEEKSHLKRKRTVSVRTYKPNVFSSILKLECGSQNTAQPKFYKQLFQNTNFELNLYDIKLLLKSASDEFHALFIFLKENLNGQQPSELFHWLNLTNDINGLEDIYNRLSSILTMQERNLIKLINLYDLGLSTFIHMLEKLKNNLNNEQEVGPFYEIESLREKFKEWKNLMTLDTCDLLQPDPIGSESLEVDDKDNDRMDNKSNQTILTGNDHNQSTLNLIISLQQSVNQRLSELNMNLVNNVNKIESKKSIICQQFTSKWMSNAIIWICLHSSNTTVEWNQLFEKICNSQVENLFIRKNTTESDMTMMIKAYSSSVEKNKDKGNGSVIPDAANEDKTTSSSSCIDYNDINNWIYSCFKANYESIQKQLLDFQTKDKLYEVINLITNQLDDISNDFNINTCLSKYFKDKGDHEVWELQRKDLDLAKQEFIQAWHNLASEIFPRDLQHTENVQSESPKESAKHASQSPNNNLDLDQLRTMTENKLFCIDSLDYLDKLVQAALERKKKAIIRRNNLEESIKSKEETINKLEKEMEDIDRKLVELRTKLGETFESLQLEAQQDK